MTDQLAFEIEITELPDDAEPDVVELVLADGLARRAAAGLIVLDEGAKLTSGASFATTDNLDRHPAMQLAIVNARDNEAMRAVVARRRAGVLGVAVIGVDSTSDDISVLAAHFDAYLRVPLRGQEHADAPLAAAASALTACIAADRLAIPVDAVYPFFANAGELSWGRAAGSDLAALTRRALRLAGLRGKRQRARVLAHIRTGSYDETFTQAMEVLTIIDQVAFPGVAEWACSMGNAADDLAVSIISTKARRFKPRNGRL